jgi:hypothetical protein
MTPTSPRCTVTQGLLQLAMYAQHLGTGSSLLCRTIKADTIKRYVNAAASLHSLFGPHPYDYRKDSARDNQVSPTISRVYDEQKRWEDVPDRREPFTLEMLDTMSDDLATSERGPNTMAAALVDWFTCGLFAGLRLGEWAQDANQSDITSYKLNKRNDAMALSLGDVRFEDANRRQCSAVEAAAATNLTIVKCWIKFRTQKNEHNGEEKLFIRNTSGKCFPP